MAVQKVPKAKAKDSTDSTQVEKGDSKVHSKAGKPAAERDTKHRSEPAATTAGYMDTAKTIALLLVKDSKDTAKVVDCMGTQLHCAPKVEARKGDQPTWQMGIHRRG